MKTIEEKLSDYLDIKSGDSLGSPINALSVGFEDGYAEALRWRDPKEELPEPTGDFPFTKYLVQVGIFANTYLARTVTVAIYECGKWKTDINDEDIFKIEVIGWRPIE